MFDQTPVPSVNDQAEALRSLKMAMVRSEAGSNSQRPPTLVVTGGKGGVGATTLVVNVAAALARRGRRTTILSASQQPGDISLMCGVDDRCRSTKRPLAHLECQMGLMVAPQITTDCHATAIRNAFETLSNLDGPTDLAVVDAGSGFVAPENFIWQNDDAVLFVCTCDDVAIMDTYAAIKRFITTTRSPLPPIGLLVNRVKQSGSAQATHDRIASTCARFLSKTLRCVGEIPEDAQYGGQQTGHIPVVLQTPNSKASRAIDHIAAMLARRRW